MFFFVWWLVYLFNIVFPVALNILLELISDGTNRLTSDSTNRLTSDKC